MSIMSGKTLAKPQLLNKHDGLKRSGFDQGKTNITCAIHFNGSDFFNDMISD